MNHHIKEAIEDINLAALNNQLGLAMPLGMLATGSSYGTQIADAFMGDTNAINSGELPLNYVLQTLGLSTGGLAGLGLGSINGGKKELEELLKSIPEVTRDKSNIHAKDMRGELQRILKTEGESAAKKAFAAKKDMEDVEFNRLQSERNSKVGAAMKELKTKRGARRMAGAALGALVGSGVAATQMVDDQY